MESNYLRALQLLKEQKFSHAKQYLEKSIQERLGHDEKKDAFVQLIKIVESEGTEIELANYEKLYLKFLDKNADYATTYEAVKKILSKGLYGDHHFGHLLDIYIESSFKIGKIKKSNEILKEYISYLVKRKNVSKSIEKIKLYESRNLAKDLFLVEKVKLKIYSGSTVELRDFFRQLKFNIKKSHEQLKSKDNVYTREDIYEIVKKHEGDLKKNPEANEIIIQYKINEISKLSSLKNGKKLVREVIYKLIEGILQNPYYLPYYALAAQMYQLVRLPQKHNDFKEFVIENKNNPKFEATADANNYECISGPSSFERSLYTSPSGNKTRFSESTSLWSKEETTNILKNLRGFEEILEEMVTTESESNNLARDIEFLMKIGKDEMALEMLKRLKKLDSGHYLVKEFLNKKVIHYDNRPQSKVREELEQFIDKMCTYKKDLQYLNTKIFERQLNHIVDTYGNSYLKTYYEDLVSLCLNLSSFHIAHLILKKVRTFFDPEQGPSGFINTIYLEALVYFNEKKPIEALNTLMKANLDLPLNDIEKMNLWYLEADILESLGSRKKAWVIFKNITMIDPNFRNAHYRAKCIEKD